MPVTSIKHLRYWLSCPVLSLPACLSSCLFAYFLLACLSVCLHTWVTLFMHIWLDIICILALLSAVMLLFPYLTFCKKPVTLALSGLLQLHLQLHSSCIQMSIYTPHTQQTSTPIGLRWWTTFNQSLCRVHPFIHLQLQSLAAFTLQSSAHFLPFVFPPKVLWLHWRLCVTSVSVTLGRCFTASQTVNCYYSHLKTSTSH